ncbi:MAG TPA: sigma-70 family RNA polymerase sigma factor [Gemmataceae bacterium]|nr:sigma-70 family RNA polymerase sigma factor [Gemmataceae bacterium]
MANGQIGNAVRFVLRAVAAPAGGALSDAQLLERFTTARDEAAFETLLWRHGPMVLGTCRRVLRHPQDAEDAFQATFLVLARKAGAIGKRESVGSWLYKVAYRAALRARARAARQPRSGAAWPEPAAPEARRPADDLRPVLDAELNRLPEKYRAPLVLHYLEGKTVEQAARELGCPSGTLASRLARGRELLRDRLARRGVALTAALFGAGLAGQAAAGPVPTALALGAAHGALAGAGPAAAAALARGVLHGMALARVKLAAVVVLAVGVAGTGAGLLARQAPSRPQEQAPRPQAAAGQPKAEDAPKDPLPAGALARLGTFRLRHGAAVRAVAFSADGKVLASAAGDWTVRLWDTATGREVGRMGGGVGAILSMGLSADGKVIAAALETKTGNVVRLWDGAGKELRKLDAPGGVQAVALTPDGKVLATAEKAGPIRLWDVTTGKELLRLAGHTGAALAVAFAADGKTLASGGADNALRLWDVKSGKELRAVTGHANPLTAVAFGPGGKRLASTSLDGTVRVWDAATGGELRRFTNHRAATRCVAFAPDGKSVVSGGDDRALRQWDVATGRELRQLPGPRGPVLSVAFSADGKRLAAGTGVFQVHLWDAASGRELHQADGHRGPVGGMALSPDGKLLATGGNDWAVCLWDVAARKQRWRVEGHTGGATAVAFAPDGRSVASASYDGTIALWAAATGRELRRCRQGSSVVCVAFAPDGKSLAAGGDRTVYVWDVTSGAARQLNGHTGTVGAVAFSPDGTLLASAGEDKTLRLWSVATGEQLYSVPGVARSRDAVAFSPDGRTVAVHDGAVMRLLEAATGKERGRFELKTTVIGLGFAADGRHLLFSPNSLEVRIHDLAANRQVRQFPGHLNWTHRLATTPDGKLLASASSDGTVLLWGLGAPAGPRPPARRLLPDRLRLAWEELAGDDAAAAYRALWGLAGAPEQALPLLKKGLAAPAGGRDDKRVAALLAELDHDEFAVRERAEAALAKLGPAAGPALRKVLEGAPSAEVRSRVERLLKVTTVALPSGEELRRLRALEVLEQINTPEARRQLEEVARGTADRAGREAKAALARLARRPPATP